MKKIYTLPVIILIIAVFSSCGGEKTVNSELVIGKTEEKALILPQEMSLPEYEKITGKSLTYSENPVFTALVEKGKLPPVEDRIPSEPLVVNPYDRIGKYGGELLVTSFTKNTGTAEINTMRQANLVRFADDFKTVVPAVAKGWEYNTNKTELTIYLRKGHKWSDGEPFTADDIIFWWNDIVKNPELTSIIPMVWISGGEPVDFSKVNETTLSIRAKKPIPNMIYTLTDLKVVPYAPAHYLKKLHIKYNVSANTAAIEKGFKDWIDRFHYSHDIIWIDEWFDPDMPVLTSHMMEKPIDDEKRIFIANPYYYAVDTEGNQLPYITRHKELFSYNIDTINRRIIEGKVDLKAQILNVTDYPMYQKYSQKAGMDAWLFDSGNSQSMMFSFNATHKDPVLRNIFGDIRFRRAMSLSVNREEIADLVFQGTTIPQQAVPNPESSFMGPHWKNNFTDYDPVQAEKMLDEMGLKKNETGWRIRPDGKVLSVNYEYSTQGGPVEVHSYIKKHFETVGIQVYLKEVTTRELRKRLFANDHDIAVWKVQGFWEFSLIRHPEYYIPPYSDTTPMVGIPWEKWIYTNGKEGLTPPDDVIKLFHLASEAMTYPAGSEEYRNTFSEMVRINMANLWITGTVGQLKGVVIKKNRLKNFPDSFQTTEYSRMMPYRPYQWYLDEN